jgi:hypothetical protein
LSHRGLKLVRFVVGRLVGSFNALGYLPLGGADADRRSYRVNSLSAHVRRVTRLGAVALVVVYAMAAPPPADALPPARSPVRVGASFGPGGSTSVLGVAWKVDNTPIPNAHVQLRNLLSGKVEANAVADQIGQFTFPRIESGTYVVELIGQNGKILTVGHAFVIAPGETVATFVRLGTKVPWFTGFFQNAAAAVASTAASQGITAIAPVQLPLTNNK